MSDFRLSMSLVNKVGKPPLKGGLSKKQGLRLISKVSFSTEKSFIAQDNPIPPMRKMQVLFPILAKKIPEASNCSAGL